MLARLAFTNLSGQGGNMSRQHNGCKPTHVLTLGALVGILGCVCQIDPTKPEGNAERGAILFASGDGTGSACQSCHCTDAGGDCRLRAPDIQRTTYDVIDTRTRDTSIQHPGNKFDLTDQDIADLEAYLATFDSG